MPFELWLGRGRPVNPYLRGVILSFLRSEMKPKELSLPPEHLFEMPGMRDFLEWSALRAWVKQWLKYCKWYFCTALDPWVSIEDFLKAPVVYKSWKLNRVDPTLTRVGLLWKIYDLVAWIGLSFQLPILGRVTGFLSPLLISALLVSRVPIPFNQIVVFCALLGSCHSMQATFFVMSVPLRMTG